MIINAALAIAVAASLSFAGQLPQKTDLAMTDWNGKQYYLDSLLDAGEHIIIQQTFSF